MQGERSESGGIGIAVARLAGIAALIVLVVLVVMVLFGGDNGTKYKLLFETGGQLVPGNQVLVGGTVTLGSRSGEGTTVTAVVPMSRGG